MGCPTYWDTRWCYRNAGRVPYGPYEGPSIGCMSCLFTGNMADWSLDFGSGEAGRSEVATATKCPQRCRQEPTPDQHLIKGQTSSGVLSKRFVFGKETLFLKAAGKFAGKSRAMETAPCLPHTGVNIQECRTNVIFTGLPRELVVETA